MRKYLFATAFLLLAAAGAYAQTAKSVLDKCAATVTTKDGASASFTMSSAQYGNAQGTIAIKGRMFHSSTSTTSLWFDGKTLWTYIEKNDEVNISTPTEQQLQTLNPYNFINLYKKGYTTTMTSSASTYNVHLTANNGQKIQEAFVTVDKASYAPLEIKILQANKWTTFTVSNLKAEKLSDAAFKFDKSKYPDVEVIDLR